MFSEDGFETLNFDQFIKKIRFLNHNSEYTPNIKKITYWGNLDLLNKRKISVVGSRKMSQYGKDVINLYVKHFVKNDVVTVSGGMYGVDLEVHLQSLKNTGNTIIVLGFGINFINKQKYLTVLKKFLNKENTLVISEFDAEQSPTRWTFPKRNYTVAWLSESLLIIEAAKKSGSLITSDYALEMGKDIYVVPGNIFNDQSEGKHSLIKQGAYITDRPSDIVINNSAEVDIQTGHKRVGGPNNINERDNLNEKEEIVLRHIKESALDFDSLSEKVNNLDIAELNSVLTNLEVIGKISVNLLGEYSYKR